MTPQPLFTHISPLPASPVLSVLVCTRNPQPEYLAATLQALREQTLPSSEWELIIVDNGSSPAVELDLSWHPQARIVIEPELGILAARLTAIREAGAELLCFFDDDTPPCATYLADGVEIGRTHTWLGAWGAAEIAGKFEVPVAAWAKPFLHMLALREEKGNFWSNTESWRTIPYSGGMVFRKAIGQEFLNWVGARRNAHLLGRKADALLSHEDIALARMAFRLNLGTGIFEALRLTHFIPKRRLEANYLSRLSEGFGYSGILSKWINGESYRPAKQGKINQLLEFTRALKMTPQSRACWRAARRGRRNALRFIAQQEQLVRAENPVRRRALIARRAYQ